MRPVRSSARLLLSGVFLASGARALAFPGQLEPQAKQLTDLLQPDQASPRWPHGARTLVRLYGATQLGAGVLLATGYLRRPAAAVLAASLIPATIAGHAFWTCDEPGERRRQQVHFLKNLGLFGGLLLAAADTEGRPSIGWRAGRLLRGRRRVRETILPARTGQRWP